MERADFEKWLRAIRTGPAELEQATSGLEDSTLRYKPRPEKWSILEIVSHLADIELVYGYRMRQLIADVNPTIAPIDQDRWASGLRYAEASLPQKLALFRILREANLALLERTVERDWQRGAFHPEYKQPLTLATLIERMANHIPNHLRQIEELKRQARAQSR